MKLREAGGAVGDGRIKPRSDQVGSSNAYHSQGWMELDGVVLASSLSQQLGPSCHLCLFAPQQFLVPATYWQDQFL